MRQGKQAPITQVLINLQKSDSRFKTWKPWMIPGAKFRTLAGNVYQISEIDQWGNFDCQELGKAAFLHSFRCDLVALQMPLK